MKEAKERDILSLRGKLTANTVERITLFDGRFDTAYEIISFVIVPEAILGIEGISAKLTTELFPQNANWFWAKNTEVGWAAWNAPSGIRESGSQTFIDKEALIVEDLFIDAAGDASNVVVNYMIELRKVKISDWKGALAMVRNKAQGSD